MGRRERENEQERGRRHANDGVKGQRNQHSGSIQTLDSWIESESETTQFPIGLN